MLIPPHDLGALQLLLVSHDTVQKQERKKGGCQAVADITDGDEGKETKIYTSTVQWRIKNSSAALTCENE